jgi:mono/diheme cytochrome c family protein
MCILEGFGFELKSVLGSCVLSVVLSLAVTVRAAEPEDYLRDVKPILQRRCYACHGALKQKAGLRLDTAAAARKGSDGGAVIEPGKPQESRLIELVTAPEVERMPPKDQGTPLSAEEIEILRRWIAAGATGPDDEKPQSDPRE